MNRLARLGLIAKGIVYLALGAMAFMAAFEWGGQNEENASRTGVFQWLKESGGSWLLLVVAAGLVCYCIWRFAEAFTSNGGGKKTAKRLRYFLSGLAYTSVAFTAGQLALQSGKSDSGSHWTTDLMSRPGGQIFAIVAALVLAGIGVYQLHYSLSGKYKKHVQGLGLGDQKSALLLRSGKIGYLARGVVWLILAYLLGRAALQQDSSGTGDTSKAFQFLEQGWTFGSYLLGAVGLGVIAYGIFSFVRARYERF